MSLRHVCCSPRSFSSAGYLPTKTRLLGFIAELEAEGYQLMGDISQRATATMRSLRMKKIAIHLIKTTNTTKDETEMKTAEGLLSSPEPHRARTALRDTSAVGRLTQVKSPPTSFSPFYLFCDDSPLFLCSFSFICDDYFTTCFAFAVFVLMMLKVVHYICCVRRIPVTIWWAWTMYHIYYRFVVVFNPSHCTFIHRTSVASRPLYSPHQRFASLCPGH